MTTNFGVFLVCNPPLLWYHDLMDETSRKRIAILWSKYSSFRDGEYDAENPLHMRQIPCLGKKIETEQAKQYMFKLVVEAAHRVLQSPSQVPVMCAKIIEETQHHFATLDAKRQNDPDIDSTIARKKKREQTTPTRHTLSRVKSILDANEDQDLDLGETIDIKTGDLFSAMETDLREQETQRLKKEHEEKIAELHTKYQNQLCALDGLEGQQLKNKVISFSHALKQANSDVIKKGRKRHLNLPVSLAESLGIDPATKKRRVDNSSNNSSNNSNSLNDNNSNSNTSSLHTNSNTNPHSNSRTTTSTRDDTSLHATSPRTTTTTTHDDTSMHATSPRTTTTTTQSALLSTPSRHHHHHHHSNNNNNNYTYQPFPPQFHHQNSLNILSQGALLPLPQIQQSHAVAVQPLQQHLLANVSLPSMPPIPSIHGQPARPPHQ